MTTENAINIADNENALQVLIHQTFECIEVVNLL